MRWRKQLSRTWDDPKIAALVSRRGLAGFGLWCRVLDIIADSMDSTDRCSVRYPISHWASLLQIRPANVERQLGDLGCDWGCGSLATVSRQGGDIIATIPNLLKYRDEYSQKSRQTPDKLPTKIEKQNIDTEIEQNSPHKPPKGQAAYSEGFLIFWKEYPAKVGKDAAWRKWKELATTPEIRKQIISSVKDHAEHDQRWLDGKICNPATFLHQGRWKDELPKNGNGLKDYTDEEVERLIERSQRLHTSH